MNSQMTTLIANGRFLKVEGPDFNGKTFDGPPIVTVTPELYASALVDGLWLESTNVKHIETRGNTDYTWFGVEDEYDNVTWAGPGDYLFQLEHGGKRLVVVPGAVMALLLAS